MKKIILLAFALLCIQANAQTINSLTVVPQNPTTADSIWIIAECMFTSGSCETWMQSFNINGNSISAAAMHCLGMLTVICTDTDSFAIGILPAGTYNVTYQVDEGHGGPPCTPGIVPGPTMNTSFTVSTTTGVGTEKPATHSLDIYPNPAGNEFTVRHSQSDIRRIEILNVLGEVIYSEKPVNVKQHTINASSLSPGIYIVRVMAEKTEFISRFIKE